MSDVYPRIVVVDAPDKGTALERARTMLEEHDEDDRVEQLCVVDLGTGVLETLCHPSCAMSILRDPMQSILELIKYINQQMAWKEDDKQKLESLRLDLKVQADILDLDNERMLAAQLHRVQKLHDDMEEIRFRMWFGGPIKQLKELYKRDKEYFPYNLRHAGLNMDTGWDDAVTAYVVLSQWVDS